MINKNSKIFVAGHNGLVGSAIIRKLKEFKFKNVITASKKELDLRDQKKVKSFINYHKPKSLVIAAAKVGGIKANNELSAEFIYDNLQIQNNLINAAFENNVKNLVFLGSSCIYPKFSKQPMKESYLLTGKLETTNEAYAIAKIAGVKMCEYYNKQYGTNYKSLMPCNTFGPNDNYNLSSSHFLPALIRKIHEAHNKNQNYIEVWGNGKTKRELIYVDDIADATIFFLFKKSKHHLINIGTEKEYSIEKYAKIIMNACNTKLKIKYINRSLIGTPRKVMDCSLARKLGWKSKIDIYKGIKISVEDFKKNLKKYST
mgnify:CR=1 FL=1|tara:strand:- start:48 stop:992 length:945 start_codon:yes stop_codon:yes gene_type:complete